MEMNFEYRLQLHLYLHPNRKISPLQRLTLNDVLAVEGQPCSFCFAIVSLRAFRNRLTTHEAEEYTKHLRREHGMKPYHIDR